MHILIVVCQQLLVACSGLEHELNTQNKRKLHSSQQEQDMHLELSQIKVRGWQAFSAEGQMINTLDFWATSNICCIFFFLQLFKNAKITQLVGSTKIQAVAALGLWVVLCWLLILQGTVFFDQTGEVRSDFQLKFYRLTLAILK